MKTVLITGSSTGIGYETALTFARAGYTVIATMRNLKNIQTINKIVEHENLNLHIMQLDVTNGASVQMTVESIIQEHGQIDILINNAGSGFRGTVEQTTFTQLEEIMNVNFFGTWRLVQAVLPYMRKNKSGRIISVSSVGGVIGVPFNDAYCAAKFAVEGMMESLAPVAKRLGIHISLVEPGPVNSHFVASVIAKSTELSAELEDDYGSMLQAYMQASRNTFVQLGQTPDEVATIILEIAAMEQPHLRYQTSEFSRKVVESKLRDCTGNMIVEFGGSRLQ